MNYHQELLKIVSEIYGNEMIIELFENIMIHSPKAIVDAYKRIEELDELDELEPDAVIHLKTHVMDKFNITLSENQLRLIINELENNRFVSAVKKLREFTRLGLREAKDVIDVVKFNYINK